ncbi:hypothetical protein FNF27_03291 [Cafeteria roenbergensis]|uniref:Uncharacterized protein n=1 Tax=Cafeteria roenbergensis TaxID=33653 RepID=A0A5A8EBJ8_CAFRO|nr:hypothetical protein FNF27_03291 [Cafeteria roenbergensis]
MGLESAKIVTMGVAFDHSSLAKACFLALDDKLVAVHRISGATEREARAEKLDPARLSQDTAQSNLQAVTEAVRVVLDASPKLAWARVQAVYSDPETRAFIVHRAMHGISELEGLAGVVCGFQSLAEVDVFQLRRRTAMFQRLFAGLHAACEADVAAMGMGTIMAEISRQTRGRAAPTASAAAAVPAAS